MTQIVWPSYTDDSGTLQDGTEIDAAFLDSIESGINTLVHSAANPTVTPVNIIDEVVTARGTLANLGARLNVEHNTDGTHNLSANIVTTSVLAESLAGQNLCANPDFLMWPDGDSAAPAYYALSGAGATIARTGTGLGDTRRLIGPYAALVTYGSATARLTHQLIDAGRWANADNFEGEDISFTVWVYSSTVNQVRAFVYTGTAGYEYSGYHTGVAGWERLEVTETILATADELAVGVEIAGTGDFYASGFVAVMGDTPTDRFIPMPMVVGAVHWMFSGTPSTGDGQRFHLPARHTEWLDVQVFANTAPSGGAFTIDIETGDGSVWASLFAATVSVDDTDEFASSTVDHATYANHFSKPLHLDNADLGAAGADQAVVRLNVDAVNSAADITIALRGRQYVRPLEAFLAYND